MPKRQHCTPLLIADGKARALTRVDSGDRSIDEARLQEILFDHPGLIPGREFDPSFSNLFSVVRELPTNVGPADLLCATPDGFLALIETKLWRNPQARREVVGQIIDYAKDMARWSYDDLENAVKGGIGLPANSSLVSLAREHAEDFDEAEFVDTVARNLRAGRFLLLLIGDGIHESIEEMTEFLQQTPHLHFTLGLVELGLFKEPTESEDRLFVQPMIVGRTREVTRAVVELRVPVRPEDIRVTLPETPSLPGRHKITEDEFFEQLAANTDGTVVQFAHDVLARARKEELEVAWMDAGPCLRFREESTRTFFTLGQLNRSGMFSSSDRFFERVESDFNFDFNATNDDGENHVTSVFLRNGDDVYRTYYTDQRGVEYLGSHC